MASDVVTCSDTKALIMTPAKLKTKADEYREYRRFVHLITPRYLRAREGLQELWSRVEPQGRMTHRGLLFLLFGLIMTVPYHAPWLPIFLLLAPSGGPSEKALQDGTASEAVRHTEAIASSLPLRLLRPLRHIILQLEALIDTSPIMTPLWAAILVGICLACLPSSFIRGGALLFGFIILS